MVKKKKNTSYEVFKKVLLLNLAVPLIGYLKIFYTKYGIVANLFLNWKFFIYQGQFFVKFLFIYFMQGYLIGNFILTRKLNFHNSFKKLRQQKR